MGNFTSAREKQYSTELEEAGVPENYLPVEEAGLTPPKTDTDLFQVRMQSEQWIYEMWRSFAGMVTVKHAGKWYLKPIKKITPIMNRTAAMEIIGFLRMNISAPVVLGNISENEKNIELSQIWSGLSRLLMDRKRLGMTDEGRRAVMRFLIPVINHNMSRAVKGHESKLLQTQIQQQSGEQVITNVNSHKSGFFNRPGGGD